jgi:hypothetical protein
VVLATLTVGAANASVKVQLMTAPAFITAAASDPVAEVPDPVARFVVTLPLTVELESRHTIEDGSAAHPEGIGVSVTVAAVAAVPVWVVPDITVVTPATAMVSVVVVTPVSVNGNVDVPPFAPVVVFDTVSDGGASASVNVHVMTAPAFIAVAGNDAVLPASVDRLVATLPLFAVSESRHDTALGLTAYPVGTPVSAIVANVATVPVLASVDVVEPVPVTVTESPALLRPVNVNEKVFAPDPFVVVFLMTTVGGGKVFVNEQVITAPATITADGNTPDVVDVDRLVAAFPSIAALASIHDTDAGNEGHPAGSEVSATDAAVPAVPVCTVAELVVPGDGLTTTLSVVAVTPVNV